ncbi:uncharacterized protein LOC142242993 [Haematobia irritans]|uniref:uncharacterized protein LOC142242993 n=1 Tax=Haematobia irritans TaxID=7368 RepID=UPI003F50288C
MSSDNDNGTSKKKLGGSLVWQLYTKLKDSRMKCLICMHEQRYLGNTANALTHLKVKHNIEARRCGLKDPENVKRMKELCPNPRQLEQSIAYIQDNEFGEDENPLHMPRKSSSTRQEIPSFEDALDFDPYNSDNELPVEVMVDNKNFARANIKTFTESINNPKQTFNDSPSKRKDYSLEDKRIIAETEYYREKAAYFRIQKHLALLQAKKVKYELKQLFGN